MNFKIKPWHKKEYRQESDNDYETLPYIDQSIDDNVAYDTISKVFPLFGKYRPDVVIGKAVDREIKQAVDSEAAWRSCLSDIKHVVSGVLRGICDIVEDFVTSLIAILFPCFVVAAVVLGPYCYADLSALG